SPVLHVVSLLHGSVGHARSVRVPAGLKSGPAAAANGLENRQISRNTRRSGIGCFALNRRLEDLPAEFSGKGLSCLNQSYAAPVLWKSKRWSRAVRRRRFRP